MTFKALATLILPIAALAVACGSPSDAASDAMTPAVAEAVGASTCRPDSGKHETDATFTSAVGSTVEFTVVDTGFPTGSGCAQGDGILIDYDDHHGFLGGGSVIDGVVVVHGHERSGAERQIDETRKIFLSLFGDASNKTAYRGIVCGLDGAAVDSVELAFSDGAGHTWDSNDSKNYVVRLADHEDHADLTSGLGAPIGVSLRSGFPTGSGCASAGLVLSYTDKKGFFENADTISAFVKVAAHRGAHDATASQTVLLTAAPIATSDDSGGRQYGAIVCGAVGADEVLDGLELAFSDVAKTKWDSNASKNYALRCTY